MLRERIVDILADLVDDARDAREFRGEQIQTDFAKAAGLALLAIGQACIDKGLWYADWAKKREAWLSKSTFFGGRVEQYEAPSIRQICGARGPLGHCILPYGHPSNMEHWDRVGTWERGLCPAAHNSSEKGWQHCQREFKHPGKHNTVEGVEWETSAPEEQDGFISVEYDD